MAKKDAPAGTGGNQQDDPHAGCGGSYVVEGGQRVLKERTDLPANEGNQEKVNSSEGSKQHVDA